MAQPGVQRLLQLAIDEDVGSGDVTTEAIFRAPRHAVAAVVARTDSVMCGGPVAAELFQRFDPQLRVQLDAAEGQPVPAGGRLLTVRGDVRPILTAERCVLNFLMHLGGVAQAARRAVRALPEGCRARIYDTRKTTPGWRLLDKAAVRVGGAQNHRVGLFDAVLIKDNHIAAAGSVRAAVQAAKAHTGGRLAIEVEIDNLDQLEEALAAGPDIVLLDNFDLESLALAVRQTAGRAELEASGGIILERIGAVARTGVDRISLGALTHTVVPADLGLDMLEDA